MHLGLTLSSRIPDLEAAYAGRNNPSQMRNPDLRVVAEVFNDIASAIRIL